MTIGTTLHTMFFGQFVGQDAFGNRYYQSRRAPKTGRRARWVMYKGLAEPSKVPPEWHGWLHYSTDAVPGKDAPVVHHRWEKAPQPNLTGTKGAYLPPGHVLKGGQRSPATADYQAWTPS